MEPDRRESIILSNFEFERMVQKGEREEKLERLKHKLKMMLEN